MRRASDGIGSANLGHVDCTGRGVERRAPFALSQQNLVATGGNGYLYNASP